MTQYSLRIGSYEAQDYSESEVMKLRLTQDSLGIGSYGVQDYSESEVMELRIL